MKYFIITICLALTSLSFSSCSLFKGGGGGSHCPAYGASIDTENEHQISPIRIESSRV